ncbi:hypothetical protein Ciccas_003101 [Cichlidogyrus casuarinus]|uniref:CCR4-NOT transcription complex subunit 1 CAF1-binding domain-containing protein n=1 Tax=Cichlidogyrus casuarinus TaxID=1844966 RepID=A0ABD2QFI9_9PLAT
MAVCPTKTSYQGSKQHSSPGSEGRRRICFLLNNLTESNLEDHVLLVAELLPHQSIRWLSTLLLNRLKSESNLVQLYVDFVTNMCIHHRNFGRSIFNQLTQDIDSLLLQLSTDPSNENARKLKNMGAFLGRLTIARDIRLCIDLKILVFNAYRNNKNSLDYFLPFICEILKSVALSNTANSEVPWVKEILQVLKELYEITDRLPIQFEVELLFTSLKADLASTSPAFYLRHIQ